MKLKYIFTALFATLALAVACEPDYSETKLEEIQLSQSTVAIPLAGGSQTITVRASDSWSFVLTEKNKNGEDVSVIPSWLTISPTSGSAGETKVTFSANPAVAGSGAQSLKITCGVMTQYLTVLQGVRTAEPSTCAQVIAGPDGKTFQVTGVCTSIVNTTYGNWYLQDKTGTIYIYGTLDKKGAEKNFTSLGLEVGDVVTVEGPKTTYGSVIELVNVMVIKIEKSLLKVTTPAVTLPKEGGELAVKAAYKGNGAYATIPAEYADWISYVTTEYIPGVPTKIVPNPSDTAVFKFNIAPNEAGSRSGTLTFSSSSGKTSSNVSYSFTQEGSIVEATAEMINNAPDGPALFKYSGIVTNIVMDKNDPTKPNKYGNFHLADATGTVYVYGLLPEEGGAKGQNVITAKGIKIGDIVTVIGPKGSYKGSPQLVDAWYVSHNNVIVSTVADFLAAAESKTQYYRLTGTVSNITSTTYGNFDLTDETGTVYFYGLVNFPTYKADGKFSNNKSFESLDIKDGDKITVCGLRSSYKGNTQATESYFVMKE